MPLTDKGEKIKGAMEEKYGAEKGEKVFYASKNKGTITGVDAMAYGHPVVEITKRVADIAERFDAFMARRRIKKDENRRKMADARIAKSKRKLDAFEEAKHPRNAGGTFTTGEGEEGEETDQEGNAHEELRKGALSKNQ
jgi:hypothetical protein